MSRLWRRLFPTPTQVDSRLLETLQAHPGKHSFYELAKLARLRSRHTLQGLTRLMGTGWVQEEWSTGGRPGYPQRFYWLADGPDGGDLLPEPNQ